MHHHRSIGCRLRRFRADLAEVAGTASQLGPDAADTATSGDGGTMKNGDGGNVSARLNGNFQQIWQPRNAHKRSLVTVHMLRRCTVQCSVCHAESHNLREYSRSAVDAQNRKTIQTQYLCGVCRIVLLINPKLAATRSHEAVLAASRARRIA